MSEINKKYWKWDRRFDDQLTVKLGESISHHLECGLLIRSEETPLEYTGKDGVPWKVKTDDEGIVKSIAFRRHFFKFLSDDLWDKEWKHFEKAVDQALEPASEVENGDFLYIVTRGYFVAIAMLIRTSAHE